MGGSANLRVYPVTGDGYGKPVEYERYAKYRAEPKRPGATGDANHDLVVYRKDDTTDGVEVELGRHDMGENLIVYPGQSEPDALTRGRGEDDKPARKASSKTSSSSK